MSVRPNDLYQKFLTSTVGFLIEEVIEQDSVGLLVTRNRANPQATKKGKRKSGRIVKYVFNDAIKQTSGYQKYFSPGSEEEMELLGLKRGVGLIRPNQLISSDNVLIRKNGPAKHQPRKKMRKRLLRPFKG